MVYKIENPNLSKVSQKQIAQFISEANPELIRLVMGTMSPRYLYWDKVKYKSLPRGITHEEFWTLVKLTRNKFLNRSETPIRDKQGVSFTWLPSLSGLPEFFHDIDLNMGGSLSMSPADIDDTLRFRFISRGIMEEAIASSQLEGANTSRKVAKKFLRERRKPRNKGEQMIFNNYQTMKAIEDEYQKKKLDKSTLLELHAMITTGTIPSMEVGRFRTDRDNIAVYNSDSMMVHQPPPVIFFNQEMDRFIQFANDESHGSFIHPIVKAIMIHFWVGYLHPFTDGNGRLARSLFYWYLLRKGYWAFGFLPLSTIIRKSPSQYGMAYLYAEQDENDLTYFIDYNISKIKQAKEEFERYVARIKKENMQMANISKTKYHLNDRQIQLLRYYSKNKDESTSTKTHMNVNQISRLTATKDLKGLEKMDFVISRKIGKAIHYFGTEKTGDIFSRIPL